MSLRLSPGTRLVERDMVGKLGVSRTGVRAALQSLESEGLVVRGARGVFAVAAVSREEARQIYEVRAALEPAMARAFIECATEEQVSALGEAVDRAEAAARAKDGAAYVDAFRSFYAALLAGSGNDIARRILENSGCTHCLFAARDDRACAAAPAVAHSGAAARHLQRREKARARRRCPALRSLRDAIGAVRAGRAAGQRLIRSDLIPRQPAGVRRPKRHEPRGSPQSPSGARFHARPRAADRTRRS